MQLKLGILEKRNLITISKSSICSSNGHVADFGKLVGPEHARRIQAACLLASFVSTPSQEVRHAKVPSCIATTSDRITRNTYDEAATEGGLHVFEDPASRLLAMRALERSQVMSRLVRLDAREPHRGAAFGARVPDNCM
jgi:hypothetical protein